MHHGSVMRATAVITSQVRRTELVFFRGGLDVWILAFTLDISIS
jgi:hypothetical protein